MLGHGGFAKVYLCEKIAGADTGHYYAIKQLDITEKSTIEKFQNECTILQKVSRDCPFISKLFYSFFWNSKFHMVMNFYGGGNLHFNVKQRGPFNAGEARFLIGQLTIAIESIHSLNYVFRDLKPENIMLDSNGNAVLIDFGLAKKKSRSRSEQLEYVGTLGYMAPEIVSKEPVGDFECAIDWWAMGVTLNYIMTGTTFFVKPGESDAVIARRICTEEPSVNNIKNKNAKNLVMALVNKNRSQRLNGVKIRDHPFFADLNWIDLSHKKIPPPFKPKMENEFDTSNFSSIYTNQRIIQETSAAMVVEERQKTENTSSVAREDARKCIETALADPNTFSLNTLLSLKSIRLLKEEPIYDLLTVFVSGNLAAYIEFLEEHKTFVDSQQGLNHEQLFKKMQLLSFKQLVENNQELTFDQLQKELHINGVVDVKRFVIEALNKKLVRVARVDKKARKVHVSDAATMYQTSKRKQKWRIQNFVVKSVKSRNFSPKRKRGHPSAPEEQTICKFRNCGYKGRRPSDLKNHLLAKHSQQQFKCKRCPKKFSWKNSLMKHKRNRGH